jgi:hypothetical protein
MFDRLGIVRGDPQRKGSLLIIGVPAASVRS